MRYQWLSEEFLNRLGALFESGLPSALEVKKFLADVAVFAEESFWRKADIEALVRGRSELVDHVLRGIWQGIWKDSVPAALLAVGGYGRGELHPYSDVDFLVLLADEPGSEAQQLLEQLLTYLWDAGLEAAHSVRTPEDCVREAEGDITIATALMEARLLAGRESLYDQVIEMTGPAHLWKGREFFIAKRDELQARHDKYHNTAYNLEPNLKEGLGGLRDIQMVGWVAKRHYEVDRLAGLVDAGFLNKQELQALLAGQHKLWEIRFALHSLAKRNEDRLLFEYQPRLAKQFGYEDEHEYNLAVEQFMQSFFRAAWAISHLCERLLQSFDEDILFDESGEDLLINERFCTYRGYLQIRNANVYKEDPVALLETFLQLQQHPELKGIRGSTARQMAADIVLVNDDVREDANWKAMFLGILRHEHGVYTQLQRMHNHGLLAACIPQYGHILGRMQYDLFHIYTVDQHTLFVVRNMRRFLLEKYRQQFPLAAELKDRLAQKELLYLAGLFHDIAKGRGGDHSELGAVDAKEFCDYLGLAPSEGRLVAWLVENHLMMSVTAQRQDISDPDVIKRFVDRVGDMERLNHLYLLTVADIWATNEELWNSWKDSLLKELYHSARKMMLSSEEMPVDRVERIAETRIAMLEQLENEGFGVDRMEELWLVYPESAYFRFSKDQILWQSKILAEHPEVPVVEYRRLPNRGAIELFIYTPDRPGLFASITAVMEMSKLNIVDARLFNTEGDFALDEFIVLEPEDSRSEGWMETVCEHLKKTLGESHIPRATKKPLSRRQKQFGSASMLRCHSKSSENRTLLEVITSDRPGLLSALARVLYENSAVVHDAKIATFGDRVEDFFLISDTEGLPLTEAQEKHLIESLREALDSGENQPLPARKAQHNIVHI